MSLCRSLLCECYASAALLAPLRQLFDFGRVTVPAGGSAMMNFNVTAAAIAEVDEATGDRVNEIMVHAANVE